MKYLSLIIFATIAFSISALSSGCASVTLSSKENHTLVAIQNTGWFLFKSIPLASGNTHKPNRVSTSPFRDTVTLKNNLKMLDKVLADHELTSAKNITSYTTDETFLFFLLSRHMCHTSAELILNKNESLCE